MLSQCFEQAGGMCDPFQFALSLGMGIDRLGSWKAWNSVLLLMPQGMKQIAGFTMLCEKENDVNLRKVVIYQII